MEIEIAGEKVRCHPNCFGFTVLRTVLLPLEKLFSLILNFFENFLGR